MAEKLDIEVMPVEDTETAVDNVDIVAACTDASNQVFDDPDWLEDGMFLVDVSPVEVDDSVLEEIDHKFTTTNRSYNHEIIGSEISAEEFHQNHGRPHDWRDTNDTILAETLQGDVQLPDYDQTVYYRNRSAGIHFTAVGDLSYETAKERELGVTVPLDWFQQHTRD